MRNAAAQARDYAVAGITQLSGIDEKTPSDRLDKCAASLRAIASLIGTQQATPGFDPGGLATMMCMVADDVERASYIAQMALLQPRR